MLFNIKIASALLVNNSYCVCKDFLYKLIYCDYLFKFFDISKLFHKNCDYIFINICHDMFQY